MLLSWIENLMLGSDKRKRAAAATARIRKAEADRSALLADEEVRRRELETASAIVEADTRRLGSRPVVSSLRPASIPDLDEAI
jgi:hypothetical protein